MLRELARDLGVAIDALELLAEGDDLTARIAQKALDDMETRTPD